jgi:hypothetical protein
VLLLPETVEYAAVESAAANVARRINNDTYNIILHRKCCNPERKAMTGFAAAIPGLGWQVGTASMSALVDRDSHQQRSKYFVDNHVLNQGFEGAVADDEAPRAKHAHAQRWFSIRVSTYVETRKCIFVKTTKYIQ